MHAPTRAHTNARVRAESVRLTQAGTILYLRCDVMERSCAREGDRPRGRKREERESGQAGTERSVIERRGSGREKGRENEAVRWAGKRRRRGSEEEREGGG